MGLLVVAVQLYIGYWIYGQWGIVPVVLYAMGIGLYSFSKGFVMAIQRKRREAFGHE